MLLQTQEKEGNGHSAIDSKIMENDIYQLAKGGNPIQRNKDLEELMLGLVMGSAGGGIKINSLSQAFKLADKFKGLSNIPAYLRFPWAKSKGFRKTGITKGKATQNDPLFEAMKRYDSKGQEIPKSRTLEYLINK
jgi:hypothetical protein